MRVKGLALELVSQHLELGDFFRMLAAGTAMRTSCLEDRIWSSVMQRKCSAFQLPDALLQRNGWHILGPLLREVHQTHAVVADVALKQEVQVERMTSTLHALNRSSQLVGPGQVFVRPLRFSNEMLAIAVEHQKQVQGDCRQGRPPSCIADAFLLHSNPVGDPVAGPPVSAVCPKCVQSHGATLYFGWQNSDLYLAVRDDGDLPSERLISMVNEDGLEVTTLDVAVCSSAFTLNYQNIEVAVNGAWKKCTTGSFVVTEGDAATIEALSAGVPCVVRIRFGEISRWA